MMRNRPRIRWIAGFLPLILSVAVAPVPAGERILVADSDVGDGGENVDLAVREVTVAPLRVYAGETVRVEAVIENKDEGMGTTSAELLVNGNAVARRLFSWGRSPGDRIHRLTFGWNTGGIPPGEYRIGAQAFVWQDTSPFDNRLEVRKPVVIAHPGGAFPGGEGRGGSATETDPRYRRNP